jgi:5,10-methylene-tetrahydrofolate dehydrogenase/methenyl tetrahydrofolate cyclohydrolase
MLLKQRQSAQIAEDVARFLKAKGKITKLETWQRKEDTMSEIALNNKRRARAANKGGIKPGAGKRKEIKATSANWNDSQFGYM